MKNQKTEEYNGWKNYETWNVALWLGGDSKYYGTVRDFVDLQRGYAEPNTTKHMNGVGSWLVKDLSYKTFIAWLGEAETPDGVNWDDSKISYKELDRVIMDMAQDDFAPVK